MASVEELDSLLQSLQALKPPGVSKSKIEAINTLCITHVGSDSTIVEKIVANFKSAPSTHKLGVLYVVDSVTRQWIEKARQTGQALIGSAAAPGTYASGVHKMTTVLPTMMTELIIHAPENQKDKIAKLIDIWEKASTFPSNILGDFKKRLQGPAQSMRTFPPSGALETDANHAAAVATNGSSLPQNVSTVMPAASLQPPAPQFQAPLPAAAPPQAQAFQLAAPATNGSTLSAELQALSLPLMAANVPAAAPQAAPSLQIPNLGDVSQQFQLLSTLAASGLTPESIAQVIAALGLPAPPAPPPLAGAAGQPAAPPIAGMPPPQGLNGSAMSQAASASGQYDFKRPRTRSRSPGNKRRRVTPAARRESPVYGVYDPTAAQDDATRTNDLGRRDGGGRGRGRDRFQRRSPAGKQGGRPPSPRQTSNAESAMPPPKYIRFEDDLPKGTIKVLSRTLFVGGVAATERELRDIFSRFGKVQTCIVNQDKRHAFVKMVNRQDALNAKAGMEFVKDSEVVNKVRSTRWGVGFGPRECSDYNTGVSVVPITALTEADKRWLLTAEYGGTGGRPLEAGMVVEEPDIEIGAGVSSKAISRRIETSAGRRQERNQGHGHSRGHGGHGGHGGPQAQSQDRYGYDRPQQQPSARANYDNQAPRYREPEPARAKAPPQILKPEPNTVGVPPAVPGFGFQLPGMNFGR